MPQVKRDSGGGSKGFGFVSFRDLVPALMAVEVLSGKSMLLGFTLQASLSHRTLATIPVRLPPPQPAWHARLPPALRMALSLTTPRRVLVVHSRGRRRLCSATATSGVCPRSKRVRSRWCTQSRRSCGGRSRLPTLLRRAGGLGAMVGRHKGGKGERTTPWATCTTQI